MTPVNFRSPSDSGEHTVIAERIVRWERSRSDFGPLTIIVLDNGERLIVAEEAHMVERKVREAGRS